MDFGANILTVIPPLRDCKYVSCLPGQGIVGVSCEIDLFDIFEGQEINHSQDAENQESTDSGIRKILETGTGIKGHKCFPLYKKDGRCEYQTEDSGADVESQFVGNGYPGENNNKVKNDIDNNECFDEAFFHYPFLRLRDLSVRKIKNPIKERKKTKS